MKYHRLFKTPFLKLVLMSVLLMFVAVACSGDDDDAPKETIDPPAKILKGSAFIPGNGGSPKPVLSKVLPGDGAFQGATVIARSLSTGNLFNGKATIDDAGNFTIEDVPFGDDYLVSARKGNILMLKFISVGSDAASPFEMGELDAASTAHVLLLENLVHDALGREDIDLDEELPTDLDVEVLLKAILDAVTARPEVVIRDLINIVINEAGDVQADQLEAAFIGADNAIDTENIASINIFLTVQQVIKAGNPDLEDTVLDVLSDWLEDGFIGNGRTVTASVIDSLSDPLSVETNVPVTPATIEEFITLSKMKTLLIDGKANIFGAGHAVAPAPAGGGAGILPPSYSFPAASGKRVTFSSITGLVGCCGPFGGSNGPDGGNLFSGTDIQSFDGISGITHGNKGMFLVGLFADNSEPSNPAPTRLNFSDVGVFSEISPGLNQVFFVGDGLSGIGSGSAQKFNVPEFATRLFLGFADGFAFVGQPGAYDDNTGELTATFVIE